jgi:hypothetical protein
MNRRRNEGARTPRLAGRALHLLGGATREAKPVQSLLLFLLFPVQQLLWAELRS